MKTGRIEIGYGLVQRSVMTGDYSVHAKAVYSLLMTYTGGKEYCFPSINTIISNLKLSKNTIIKAIRELEKADLIDVIREANQPNKYYPKVIITEPGVVHQMNQVVHDVNQGGSPDEPGVVHQMNPKNNSLRITLKNNKEDKDPLPQKVIDYLNKKTGRDKNSKFTLTEDYEKLIKARVKENSKEAVAKVIDYKCKEWLDTDLAKYLRPSTLFNKTKFKQYIEELEFDSAKKNNETSNPKISGWGPGKKRHIHA